MATRPVLRGGAWQDDEADPMDGSGFGQGGGGDADPGGLIDRGGGLQPDPTPEPPLIGQPGQDESGPEGNTDKSRDIAGPAPRFVGIPHGVTTDAGMESSNNSYAPEMPMEPTPIASQHMMPSGPQRRTQSSSAQQFDQGNDFGPALFGARTQGLEGGGLGVPGAGDSGPTPTKMMLALLRQLQGGQ